MKIDPIIITLPCGMKNGTDSIHLMHNICGNVSSKSNKLNLFVKNLNITDTTIQSGLQNELETKILDILPVSTDFDIDTTLNFK
jgi:hypothetical protein